MKYSSTLKAKVIFWQGLFQSLIICLCISAQTLQALVPKGTHYDVSEKIIKPKPITTKSPKVSRSQHGYL